MSAQYIKEINSEVKEVKELVVLVDKRIEKLKRREAELTEKWKYIDTKIDDFKSENDLSGENEQLQHQNTVADELLICLDKLTVTFKFKNDLLEEMVSLLTKKQECLEQVSGETSQNDSSTN